MYNTKQIAYTIKTFVYTTTPTRFIIKINSYTIKTFVYNTTPTRYIIKINSYTIKRFRYITELLQILFCHLTKS